MKRCPQCEFIYEDDQSLCDMDGVLLVFDGRNLPNSHALAPVLAPTPKAQKRNRAVPAFASLILALVLGMVYYVSTQRGPATPAGATTSASIPAVALPPPAPPAEVSQPPVELKSPEKEEPKPEAPKPAAAAPTKKSTAKSSAITQTKAPAAQKKDESKVGSILKKTGRILKKPFKL